MFAQVDDAVAKIAKGAYKVDARETRKVLGHEARRFDHPFGEQSRPAGTRKQGVCGRYQP